ncbi:MAG: hypothetical protein HY717_09230 [Planctomycetes bacterium]|nr:hypothetical protein [Planctomycetota bacterium]
MTARRAYSRTDLNALKTRVKARGFKAVDMRTTAAKELVAFQRGLTEDLGGEELLSTAKRALVNMAARAFLFLNHVDAWLAEQPNLVNQRNRALLPALRERQSIAEHLAKLLDRLGLEKRKPEPLSLGRYLETKAQPGNGYGMMAGEGEFRPPVGVQPAGPSPAGPEAGAEAESGTGESRPAGSTAAEPGWASAELDPEGKSPSPARAESAEISSGRSPVGSSSNPESVGAHPESEIPPPEGKNDPDA